MLIERWAVIRWLVFEYASVFGKKIEDSSILLCILLGFAGWMLEWILFIKEMDGSVYVGVLWILDPYRTFYLQKEA